MFGHEYPPVSWKIGPSGSLRRMFLRVESAHMRENSHVSPSSSFKCANVNWYILQVAASDVLSLQPVRASTDLYPKIVVW